MPDELVHVEAFFGAKRLGMHVPACEYMDDLLKSSSFRLTLQGCRS